MTILGKRYTLNLKDELLPQNQENGREQATVTYEYDFEAPNTSKENEDDDATTKLYVPWSSFKPTYRGKEKKDAKALDTKSIKRISIMMRRSVAICGPKSE